jgi:hypothetical protein
MEPTVSSETSVNKTQTPGIYPKENILHLEHGENLKSRTESCHKSLFQSQSICDRNTSIGVKGLWE